MSVGLAAYALAHNFINYLVGSRGRRLWGEKMKLLKHTKGMVDKIVGARKRSAMDKDGELLDPMQKYTTIGEYHVDAEDGTQMARNLITFIR